MEHAYPVYVASSMQPMLYLILVQVSPSKLARTAHGSIHTSILLLLESESRILVDEAAVVV